jgi:hypothetical protein
MILDLQHSFQFTNSVTSRDQQKLGIALVELNSTQPNTARLSLFILLT